MNMPIVAQFNGMQKTMSSREIAVLTESDHSNVLKTIRTLILKGVVSGNETLYRHEQNGQLYPEIHLDFRNTMVVVSGYSAELRAKIIDRWQELEKHYENSVVPQIPQSFAEALQLAADQAKQLELQAPKVKHYDAVVERNTLLNASQVAQKIGMSAVKMNRELDALDVYNKSIKRSRVFQQWFIDKGLGELKQTELGFSQPLFTTKGKAWVIEKLVSEGVAA